LNRQSIDTARLAAGLELDDGAACGAAGEFGRSLRLACDMQASTHAASTPLIWAVVMRSVPVEFEWSIPAY